MTNRLISDATARGKDEATKNTITGDYRIMTGGRSRLPIMG